MRTNAQTALSTFVVPTFDVVRPDPEDESIQALARRYNETPEAMADLAESVANTITAQTGQQAVMALVLECMEEKLQEVRERRREIEYERARKSAQKEQWRRTGRGGGKGRR